VKPPPPRPSNTCWRCHHRLLYADELAEHRLLRPRFLRLTASGALWMQCTTRGCSAWCVVPSAIVEAVITALGHLPKAVGCPE
jgi:uncharacterized protein (DUF488 family)